MNDLSRRELRRSIAKHLLSLKTGAYADPVGIAGDIKRNTQEVRQVLQEMAVDGEVLEIDGAYSYLTTKFSFSSDLDEQALTSRDRSELKLLMRNVHRAFYILGASLKRVRERRLYREQYSTFEKFCQAELNYTRQYVNYQILGAEIVENLKSGTLTTNCCQTEVVVLPTSESQMRPLTKIKDEDEDIKAQKQLEAWFEAVERAKGKVPPARIVKEVVTEKLGMPKETNKKPKGDRKVKVKNQTVEPKLETKPKQMLLKDRFLTHDIVRLHPVNPDLEEHKGAWAWVTSLEEYSYSVVTWRGVIHGVRHEEMRAIEPSVDKKMARDLVSRLSRVTETIIDSNKDSRNSWQVLRILGTMQTVELSPETNSLLECLEQIFDL